jgi:site-specific recombinase XerD
MKIAEYQELVESFLQQNAFKPNTQRAYRRDLQAFGEFLVSEELDYELVSRSQVEAWLQQYPNRLAQRRATNIRRFLLWLGQSADSQWQVPWYFQAYERDEQSLQEQGYLSSEQEERLLASSKLSLSRRALLGIILSTGASLEELSRLHWSELELGKLPHITIGEQGSYRVVPLDSDVAKLLRELREQRWREEHVFLQERQGKPMAPEQMSVLVRRATEKVLGQAWSPRDLQLSSRRQLAKEHGFRGAVQRLGRKRASALVEDFREPPDWQRLRHLHEAAFGDPPSDRQ